MGVAPPQPPAWLTLDGQAASAPVGAHSRLPAADAGRRRSAGPAPASGRRSLGNRSRYAARSASHPHLFHNRSGYVCRRAEGGGTCHARHPIG